MDAFRARTDSGEVGLFSTRRAVAIETIVVDYAVSESVLWRCPLMFSVIRSRKLAAFLLVIATCLVVSIEAQAELFPGKHKQNVVLVPGGVVMAPTFASAPVAVVGSAPVMVGAISTTSANYYTMPATGAAPTPTYFYTSGAPPRPPRRPSPQPPRRPSPQPPRRPSSLQARRRLPPPPRRMWS